MPKPLAPIGLILSEIRRGLAGGIQRESIRRAINRQGFQVGRGRLGPVLEREAARVRNQQFLSQAHGNVRPREGLGMTQATFRLPEPYRYTARVAYRTETGQTVYSFRTIYAPRQLTVAEARREFTQEAQDDLDSGPDSDYAPVGAVSVSGVTLISAEMNVL